MNTKIIVGLGVAAAVLISGGYFGATAYTKDKSHTQMRNGAYAVEDFFRTVGAPVEVRNNGAEDTGFSSDVTSFDIIPVGNSAGGLPLKVINSYGPGTVESTFDLGDSVYRQLGIEGSNRESLRALLAGIRTKYNFFTNTIAGSIDMAAGSVEGDSLSISWQPGKASFNAYNLSQTPYVDKSFAELGGLTVKSRKDDSFQFSFADLKTKNDSPSDGNFTSATSLKSLVYRNNATAMNLEGFRIDGAITSKKFVLNVSANFSADGIRFSYEKDSADTSAAIEAPADEESAENAEEIRQAQEALAKTASQRKYDIRDVSFSIKFNDLDFTKTAQACNFKTINQLSEQMNICLNAMPPQEKLKLTLSQFTSATSIEITAKGLLNSAKADLSAKARIEADDKTDLSNPFAFIGALVVTADLKMDKSLLFVPEYNLTQHAEMLKEYARSPDSDKLEYHFEFRRGVGSINGKRL
ncbi:MAG: hypothetical protein IJ523_00685 [Succinivibrionaceae bacterium]|nr:hypothetical protein [Succinivibrionaceae bacterium]